MSWSARLLIEHCPAGVALFDLRGTHIECNDRFAAIFSARPDQIMPGREWCAMLPSAWRMRGPRGWNKAKDNAAFNGHEALVRIPHGGSRALVVSGRIAEKCVDGNHLFVVAVADVTPWGRRVDRLRSASARARNRCASLVADCDQKREQLQVARVEVRRLQESLKRMNEVTSLLMTDFQQEKKETELRIITNLQITALPLLDELRSTKLSRPQQYLVETLDFSIRHVTSYFGIDLGMPRTRLSRREIDICRMIREGKDSREIASATGLAYQTVIVHRKNIRRKLGIKKSKQNLATFIRLNF